MHPASSARASGPGGAACAPTHRLAIAATLFSLSTLSRSLESSAATARGGSATSCARSSALRIAGTASAKSE
eukprot:285803-Chlamydomonas_euryale.AAC.1